MKRRAFLGWALGAVVAVAGRVWGSCGQEDEPYDAFDDLAASCEARYPRWKNAVAEDGRTLIECMEQYAGNLDVLRGSARDMGHPESFNARLQRLNEEIVADALRYGGNLEIIEGDFALDNVPMNFVVTNRRRNAILH